MRRRLVWIQGAAAYPLKILLERFDGIADGFYVGGWTPTPVFVAPFSNDTYSQILLYGITATGPGPNDWVVGGWGVSGTGRTYLFYDSTGLIAEVPITPPWTGGFVFTAAGGNFSVSVSGKSGEPFLYYTFATPTFSDNALTSDQGIGFVGNQTLSEGRLDMVVGTLRKQIVINLDYTYSVFVGNNPWDGTTYPSGNPWLVNNSTSAFVRLDTNLNTAIPQSDLHGLTLYQRSQNFNGTQPWATIGEQTLTITPYAITIGGIVTTGTPYTVVYQAPDPDAYFSWDASLWVS